MKAQDGDSQKNSIQELESVTNLNKNLVKDIELLKNELELLRQAETRFTNFNNDLVEDIELLENELEVLRQAEMCTVEKELNLKREIMSNKEVIQDFKRDLVQKTQQISRLERLLENVSGENRKQKSQLEKHESLVCDLEEQIEERNQEICMLRMKMNQESKSQPFLIPPLRDSNVKIEEHGLVAIKKKAKLEGSANLFKLPVQSGVKEQRLFERRIKDNQDMLLRHRLQQQTQTNLSRFF